mmetsp:Transcript_26748/g.76737  ORF Transcript_26748/g.76737 Transcript_26748/m.76737 type:complete len:265 (+) Transcript_26748:1423-2217(+)
MSRSWSAPATSTGSRQGPQATAPKWSTGWWPSSSTGKGKTNSTVPTSRRVVRTSTGCRWTAPRSSTSMARPSTTSTESPFKSRLRPSWSIQGRSPHGCCHRRSPASLPGGPSPLSPLSPRSPGQPFPHSHSLLECCTLRWLRMISTRCPWLQVWARRACRRLIWLFPHLLPWPLRWRPQVVGLAMEPTREKKMRKCSTSRNRWMMTRTFSRVLTMTTSSETRTKSPTPQQNRPQSARRQRRVATRNQLRSSGVAPSCGRWRWTS